MINLKTLTLQLIDGEPNGIKICRLTGSTLVTVVIPRDLLAQAKKLPEIPKRGVYYLLDDNKGRLRRVYAGQTVQGISRLDDHYAKKDWWNTAIMFLGPDSEFSLDVVSGLERQMIAYIAEHGSYTTDNGNLPNPFVSPYTESFIASLHEDILFRMGVLGYDLDAVGESVTNDGLVFTRPAAASTLMADMTHRRANSPSWPVRKSTSTFNAAPKQGPPSASRNCALPCEQRERSRTTEAHGVSRAM